MRAQLAESPSTRSLHPDSDLCYKLPHYFHPPMHLRRGTGSQFFRVCFEGEVFSKVHPYCAPFTVLVGGGYCNSKPFYCVHYPGWEPKNLGEPSCGISAGNPISVATGNKYQRDVDYAGVGVFPLSVIRHYNSLGASRGSIRKIMARRFRALDRL